MYLQRTDVVILLNIYFYSQFMFSTPVYRDIIVMWLPVGPHCLPTNPYVDIFVTSVLLLRGPKTFVTNLVFLLVLMANKNRHEKEFIILLDLSVKK